ncbi:ribonuclease H-like domain-containing protein [Tanacetum coccineum]
MRITSSHRLFGLPGSLTLWALLKSSSNLPNVAFVSDNNHSTNDVSTAYGVPNTSSHNTKHEQTSTSTSSYSLLASHSSCPQLDHEDLDQVDEYDLEEMDLKWQVAMISMRIKKFYKKTGRKLQFDAKEPVGFDKTKVECYNCHKTGHFARECRSKEENRRRDGWNTGNREGKNSERKTNLKQLYDAQREQLSDASIEIKAYTQGLKKVEAQLVAHQQVPPPMTGNYMPSGPDIEIDDSQYSYGPEKTQPSESEFQTTEIDICHSNISTETSELVCEPVVNKSKIEVKPKVWSDAPIIEEYESDSDDENVYVKIEDLDTPSFATKHVKTPSENVKNNSTHSQKPKVNNKQLELGLLKSMFCLLGTRLTLLTIKTLMVASVAFGGSRGYITGKGKIQTGKLDFEDVMLCKRKLQHFNLLFLCHKCVDKKNKVPVYDTEDVSEIPPLEDIHQDTTEGIFTHSSYDDEGAVGDFTNLETVVNVSPIPTSRVNPSHPSELILGDPTLAVQKEDKMK